MREWLKGLEREHRKVIGEDIKTVQFGWPLGMPLVRKLEAGLWEIRSHLRQGIARVLFTVAENKIILLHGFQEIQENSAHGFRNGKTTTFEFGDGGMNMNKRHLGSDFDDFLREEGMLSDATATAIKRVLAFQIAQEMKRRKLTKAAMAKQMKTSRSALDRLLDPENASVTLLTLERAASALGKKLVVKLA